MGVETPIIVDAEVYALHEAEVARLRAAGVLDSNIALASLASAGYGSLASLEEVGEERHMIFSGPFEEIAQDVINILAARIALDNRLKGFWPDGTSPEDILKMALYPETLGRNPGEALALAHSEFSEALEPMRSGGLRVMDDKLPERSGFATEIVDAIIRGLDMTGGFALQPGSILIEKLAVNRKRPYKHGRGF